jgi:hypothetical protein
MARGLHRVTNYCRWRNGARHFGLQGNCSRKLRSKKGKS